MDSSTIDIQAQEYVKQLRGWYVHLATYLTVNALLFVIDVFTPGGPWFFWPLLGWGMGVAAHGASLLAGLKLFGPEWERRKLAELHERAGHV